jgi:hypothetical protein
MEREAQAREEQKREEKAREEKKREEKEREERERAEREREEEEARAREEEREAQEEEELEEEFEEDIGRDIDLTGLEEDPLGRRRVAAVEASDEDEPEPTGPTRATGAPLAINDRSLTIAKGRLELHGGLSVSAVTLPGIMPGTETSTTSVGLPLGATYGVDDKLEVGGDYTPSLDPGSLQGPLTLRAAYRVVRGQKLEVALAAGLAFDFVDTIDPVMMTTATNTYASLQLGAWARYRLTPKVSLFTGLPALPASSASSSIASLALSPLYQLAIGLNNSGPIALDLPVGLGWQATPKVYAFASLDVAHLGLANTDSAFVFADFFPLALGGFYAHDKVDVGVVFADDFQQGFDYLRLDLVVRYPLR